MLCERAGCIIDCNPYLRGCAVRMDNSTSSRWAKGGANNMRRMTRLFIAATVAMTNFSLAVQAADLRAPVPPPVYVPSWTGFYIGGSAGYGWSNSEVNPSGTTAFFNPVE